MSVDYTVYLVSWDEVQDRLSASEDSYEVIISLPEEKGSEELYMDAMDVTDILEKLLGSYFQNRQPKGLLEKGIHACEQHLAKSSEAYPEVMKLYEVLGTLHWSYLDEEMARDELDMVVEMMEVGLNPLTVERFSHLLSSVDYEKVKPRYQKYAIASPYGGINSFEEFVTICEKWSEILTRCSDSKKGLLVYVFR